MRTLGAALLAATALGLTGSASAEVCQDCGGGGGGGTGSTNQAPTAVFSLPAEAYRNQVVDLDGSGSTDPNGNATIKAWKWDFAGDIAWDAEVAKTATSWSTLGTKTVRLQVTDDKGASNVATRTIEIKNRKPQGETGCRDFLELGQTITCTPVGAKDLDGSIVSYRWDLDGDGFDDGTEASIAFTPTATGVVRPRLLMTDDDGGETIATTAVTVWVPKPGLPFAMPATAEVGTPVTFTGQLGSGEAEGMWAYDRWWTTNGPGAWGPASAGGRVATYTFSAPGTYDVRLRQLRSERFDDATTETIQKITVTAPPAGGGGQQQQAHTPAGGGAPAASAPAPAPAQPAATGTAASAITPRTTTTAKKKTVAKKAKKTCKTVKAKKGKKTKKVCKVAKKKATRKQH